MACEYVARLVEALMAYNAARFLFACLYTDSFLDKDTVKAVKLALKRFFRGFEDSKALEQVYDEVYDEAIKRIES